MPLVIDEMQDSQGTILAQAARRYGVEIGTGVVVFMTTVVTAPGLLDAPLQVLARSAWNVFSLVGALLLGAHVVGPFQSLKRIGPIFRHGLIILLAGLVTELADQLVGLEGANGKTTPQGTVWEIGEACVYAGLFWSVCLAIRYWLAASRRGPANGLPAAPAGFLGLLPPGLRGGIRWMKAEGNYVHVFGESGSEMVKYVFARAVEEMPAPGLQVHRSYWVALDSAEALRRSDGRVFVVLNDGTRVPVSRTYQREVRRVLGRS